MMGTGRPAMRRRRRLRFSLEDGAALGSAGHVRVWSWLRGVACGGIPSSGGIGIGIGWSGWIVGSGWVGRKKTWQRAGDGLG